jgi:hypothetical protein
MRRALTLAALFALVAAGSAAAETWTKFADAGNGVQWSYDGDYSYKDRSSGRLVVIQAISKPEAHLGPSGPGKPDGVGSVVAIDCGAKNMIVLGSYSPSKPLALDNGWRSASPKKATGPENEALVGAVCPHIDHVPVK